MKYKPSSPPNMVHAGGRALPLSLQFQAELEDSSAASQDTASVDHWLEISSMTLPCIYFNVRALLQVRVGELLCALEDIVIFISR